MAVFVVDYGYCAGSHHYSGACSLAAAAAERGPSLHLLAPRDSDLAGSTDPPARYVLSHRLYHDPLAKRRALQPFWSAFRRRRAGVRRDLDRCLAGQVTVGDTVLLTTPMAPEFVGFADWHGALPAANRPAVAAHFLLPLGYDLADDLPWQEAFALLAYREAFARLQASAAGRGAFFAHPAGLAARLAAFEPAIEVAPSPFLLSDGARAAPAGAPLSIALLGRGKASKGLDLAFEAFDRLQAAGAPFRWIFQTAPVTLSAERRRALRSPNVTHVDDFPPPGRYAELLRAASIVLLPYDPAAYKADQGSGVLCEVLALGIPVICSATGHFADELARLGCPELVFRPHTGEALAAKISETAAAYSRYRALFRAQGARGGGLAPARLLERLEASARQAPQPAQEPARVPQASLLALLKLRLRSRRTGARRAGAAPGERGEPAAQ